MRVREPHDVKESGRFSGKRHWLQAPVLPEPQGFSLPSSKRKGCGRRLPRADADLAVGVVGAQQRLPRSFLSTVPVLPTAANLVAEAVYALTTHRSYSYCVITPT